MKLNEIRRNVTHLSEELQHRAVQEEEVVVGGLIVDVVPPINDDFPMYIFTVDDTIGTIHVHVPKIMYHAYESSLSKGKYAFFEGFVNIVTSQSRKEVKKNISIYSYALKDISSEVGQLL